MALEAARSSVQPRRISAAGSQLQRLNGQGGAAGVAPGTNVYSNEVDPVQSFYTPGAGERMADDLTLGSGACDVVYYNLGVVGDAAVGGTFDVQVALFDDDPCLVGSVIAGTEATFTAVPSDGSLYLLEVPLSTPATVPGTVWMAATFSTPDAGWILAGPAEVGQTDDLWSENDSALGCGRLWFGGQPYAGFWANVNCSVVGEPPGACCDGISCTELTQTQCLTAGGSWQGAFTTCDPNPCQPGACCTGLDFATCIDTTEAGCAGASDLFHPGAACADNPCAVVFKGYENNFVTGLFDTVPLGARWADDLQIGPCDLVAYDVTMVGTSNTPDYDVHVELWSNDDRGTFDETDDVPLAPITPTTADFVGVPADQAPHTLLGGPFPDVTLPERLWVVFSTSTGEAGPLLGGMANIGVSRDAFAVIDDPDFAGSSGAWLAGIWYGGFVPDGCPFDPSNPDACNPAGSFHINLWCRGEPPTGACCNDAAGTCVDGVVELQCDGRWVMGATCDANPFDPPCGTGACCSPIGCGSMTRGECDVLGETFGIPVAFAASEPCATVLCPSSHCFTATGDCFAWNTTPGCDDPFCCEAVCANDAPCCTTSNWDGACAAEAANLCQRTLQNDHCADAEPIAGVGTFSFDNGIATTDGAPHTGCLDLSEQGHITNDVWYCWTAPCNDIVSVETCGGTAVDTKIAVYEGCGLCSPTDAELLACNDDSCTLGSRQSTVLFNATVGQSYLIRIGTWPGADGGTGQFTISCGVPQDPVCPGAGDCCAANASPGCGDATCCDKVCACDPSCCEVEWDAACAGTGREGTGCGAQTLCADTCFCPDGRVTWQDPPDGAVDARQPHPPAQPGTPQGFSTFIVAAPAGADKLDCWTLCETDDGGSPNGIASVLDLQDGTFMVTLDRPITPNAVTTITYEGSGATGTFIAHAGNTSGDGFADATDVSYLIDCVQGVTTCDPWQCDADRSGRCGPADILRVLDLLKGGETYAPSLDTPLPRSGSICP